MELNEDGEVEISEDVEAEAIITVQVPTSSVEIERSTTSNKRKTNGSSSNSKRRCTFNKKWMEDPKYAAFLRECKTNPHLAHCCICKSNFSIANGGVYLVNRHADQPNHKHLAEIEAKEKCKV
jgi:hypothetical protein